MDKIDPFRGASQWLGNLVSEWTLLKETVVNNDCFCLRLTLIQRKKKKNLQVSIYWY